jgi:universal stress protein A
MTLRKILVPVDYSDCSRAALVYAADLARALGAELDIVHVWDRPPYVSETVEVRHADGATRSLLDMIRDAAEHDMTEFVGLAKIPAGVRFERRLCSGNPAATILAELELGRHDLVIVGTHGRTGLRHALLGSVAEKLVRFSPVPVLTVPTRPAGSAK